jgi:hypothetical protein
MSNSLLIFLEMVTIWDYLESTLFLGDILRIQFELFDSVIHMKRTRR